MTDNGKVLELRLDHDKEKTLSRGKRVYKDEDGHRIYLTGDEVKKLESPDSVVCEVRPG